MPDIHPGHLYAACLPLAVLIGYAIRRGSTCAVGAVSELVLKHRVRRFMSFLLCSAIVAVVLMPVVWTSNGASTLLPSYGASWVSLAGGALFGLGAVINGACNFGTIDRLGCGDTRYLFLFPGLYGGASLGAIMAVPSAPHADSLVHEINWISASWWIVCIALILTFWIASVRHKRERGTPGKPVAFYMSIIGGLTALITLALGPWHYTRIAVTGAGDWTNTTFDRILILSGLLFAVICGAVIAGIRDKRFDLRWPTPIGALASLVGGSLMGVAILLIPGGNDGIVLSGLPSLSLSAMIAYIAMCTTIALLVWLPTLPDRRKLAG